MILHNPEDMKKLALTGLDNDVRKTLMWAADRIEELQCSLRLVSAALTKSVDRNRHLSEALNQIASTRSCMPFTPLESAIAGIASKALEDDTKPKASPPPQSPPSETD